MSSLTGQPVRVMLVIYSLARGGAERVMSTLANAWAARGHEVTIITLDTQDRDAYPLDRQVERVALGMVASPRNAWHIFRNNLRRAWALRETAKRLRPHAVVSFTANVNTLTVLALLGLRTPVIISERTDPSQVKIGRWRSGLRRIFYPRAAAVVVQTRKVLNDMQRQFPGMRLAVIPNSVPRTDPDAGHGSLIPNELPGIPVGAKIIAAMGRLGTEKGFDLLIDAFRRVSSAYPDWHVVIFGKGPARADLEARITEAGLNGRIHLPGEVITAREYLGQADIFVLSSRFEGFPNVMVEAMACGRAVLSFDCPSGPAEIIRSGHDGLLVPAGDVEALADALRSLMDNSTLRAELGRNARKIVERFSVEHVMHLWNQLLSEVIAAPQGKLK